MPSARNFQTRFQEGDIQARFREYEREVKDIRKRISSQYRHEPGEQYTPMLRDLRALSGHLNVIDEFWKYAEKELKEIRDCDKCDLCEDHYA